MNFKEILFKKRSRKTIFFIGCLLGLIFFISFYGIYILNPTHVNWILSGDLKQHQIGWEMFRRESWNFPLGLIKGLAYPNGLPITFMDSIPLVAIPFKVFAKLLPTSFQYFGLWGLLCYMLQGGIGALIINHFCNDAITDEIGGCFFILSPIVLARMFAHTALASQWIILLAIYLFLITKDEKTLIKKSLIYWSIMLCLAITVHPYFVPMVFVLFVASVVMSHKKINISIVKLVLPSLVMSFVFWAIGGFYIKESNGDGLGTFNLNLNSLFNPLGYSYFLKDRENYSTNGETMCYLGLGLIFILFVDILLLLQNRNNVRLFFEKLKKDKKNIIKYMLVLLCFIAITIIAIGPNPQYDKSVLFEMSLPAIVIKIWGIFRACARLFWVVYYVIVVILLWLFIKNIFQEKNKVIITVFLCIILCLQFIDIRLSPAAINKKINLHESHSVQINYDNVASLISIAKNKKHLVYLGDMTMDDFLKGLSSIALIDNLTINNGYFARAPVKEINKYSKMYMTELKNGTADLKNYVFLSKNKDIFNNLSQEYTIKEIDGYFVVL